jgi:WD40 repeat protein
VQTLTWSPDSNRVASGSIDKTIQVWDALNGGHVALYTGHTDAVNTIAWSPNGNYIASGSADKTVQIVDATTGNHRYTYRGHSDTVSSVSWSPDGKYIVSGSFDKTVQVWNTVTGVVLYTYDGYNVKAAIIPSKGVLPDLIFNVGWSPNGKRIAAITQVYCGDLCAVVLSWDAYTQKKFTFYTDESVFAMAWSPDSTRLVTSIVVSDQGLPQGGHSSPDGNFAQIVQA